MNCRRQPFQFNSIDPAKRHAELQKRFGLPANDMYIDCANPNIMGAGFKEPNFVGSSPRLQHRVPMFTESSQQMKDQNIDSGRKPRVRVIPIQVEGVDESKRHRTFSGPTSLRNEEPKRSIFPESSFYNEKPINTIHVNNTDTNPAQPRVCNIPIHIEPKCEVKPKDTIIDKDIPKSKPIEAFPVKTNDCSPTKSKEEIFKSEADIQMEKIEAVLTKLKTYKDEVEKFAGTLKDKQYRYLDEMLTRCMLDLDNVETLGMESIRMSRKAAVKQVQASIDLLDTKVNPQSSIPESVSVNVDTEMEGNATDTDENAIEANGEIVTVDTKKISESVSEIFSPEPIVQEVGENECTNGEIVSEPIVEEADESNDSLIPENKIFNERAEILVKETSNDLDDSSIDIDKPLEVNGVKIQEIDGDTEMYIQTVIEEQTKPIESSLEELSPIEAETDEGTEMDIQTVSEQTKPIEVSSLQELSPNETECSVLIEQFESDPDSDMQEPNSDCCKVGGCVTDGQVKIEEIANELVTDSVIDSSPIVVES